MNTACSAFSATFSPGSTSCTPCGRCRRGRSCRVQQALLMATSSARRGGRQRPRSPMAPGISSSGCAGAATSRRLSCGRISGLPASPLGGLDYPDLHPSPPDLGREAGWEEVSPSSSSRRGPHDGHPSGGSVGGRGHDEAAWYCYLTEITLRRFHERAWEAFLSEGPGGRGSYFTLLLLALDAKQSFITVSLGLSWYYCSCCVSTIEAMESSITSKVDQFPFRGVRHFSKSRTEIQENSILLDCGSSSV